MTLETTVSRVPGWMVRVLAVLERRLGGHMPMASGAFWIFLIRVAGAGTSYIAQVALARWIGVEHYGVFVYGWLWLAMVGIVAPLGADGAVQRLLPTHLVEKDWARFWGAFWYGFLLVGLSGLCLAGLGYGLADGYGALIGEAYRPVLMIAALALPFWAFNEQLLAVGRALGWPIAAYTPFFVLIPFFLLVGAWILLGAGWPADAETVMWAGWSSCVFTFLISAVVVLPRALHRFPRRKPTAEPGPWLGLSFSLLLVTGSQVLLESTDVVVLGIFLAPEDVAVYFAALRTTGLMGFVFYAVTGFCVPAFARLHASGDRAAIQAFMLRITQLVFWPTLVAAVGLLVTGEFLLSLFGASFTGGYAIMVILMVRFLLQAAVGPIDQLLAVSGSHRFVATVLSLTAVLNVALNVALIPPFGVYGAAAATVLSVALANAVLALTMYRRFGVLPLFLNRLQV
ncbi:MAG: polysaccharide biosynthesis C-terminal domain-containing protein [Methyloligellaceae bacterium]